MKRNKKTESSYKEKGSKIIERVEDEDRGDKSYSMEHNKQNKN